MCVGGKEKENKERTDEEVNKRNQDRWNEAINDLQLSTGCGNERRTWQLTLRNNKLFAPVK